MHKRSTAQTTSKSQHHTGKHRSMTSQQQQRGPIINQSFGISMSQMQDSMATKDMCASFLSAKPSARSSAVLVSQRNGSRFRKAKSTLRGSGAAIDFDKQVSRKDNLWVDECLNDRFKLESYASQDSIRQSLKSSTGRFAKGKPRDLDQQAVKGP